LYNVASCWLYLKEFLSVVNQFYLTVTSGFKIYPHLLLNMLQHGVCHLQNVTAKGKLNRVTVYV